MRGRWFTDRKTGLTIPVGEEGRKDSNFPLVEETIIVLERGLREYSKFLAKPEMISDGGAPRFRYQRPNLLTFLFLKSVRVVSGIRASVCLLKSGYVQEMGV